MNKYEYKCFKVLCENNNDILNILNILGDEGWNVYQHADDEKECYMVNFWAARKISKPQVNSDNEIPSGRQVPYQIDINYTTPRISI